MDIPTRWCGVCKQMRTDWRCRFCGNTTSELGLVHAKAQSSQHELPCAHCGHTIVGASVFNESGYDIDYRIRLVPDKHDPKRMRVEVGLYDKKPGVIDV